MKTIGSTRTGGHDNLAISSQSALVSGNRELNPDALVMTRDRNQFSGRDMMISGASQNQFGTSSQRMAYNNSTHGSQNSGNGNSKMVTKTTRTYNRFGSSSSNDNELGAGMMKTTTTTETRTVGRFGRNSQNSRDGSRDNGSAGRAGRSGMQQTTTTTETKTVGRFGRTSQNSGEGANDSSAMGGAGRAGMMKTTTTTETRTVGRFGRTSQNSRDGSNDNGSMGGAGRTGNHY